jgi:ribosome-associated toxin RatA of RatAB toxin-antitoxin module
VAVAQDEADSLLGAVRERLYDLVREVERLPRLIPSLAGGFLRSTGRTNFRSAERFHPET